MQLYFSGIGGVGIGPLAEIAFDAGYIISGSDPVDGLMTQELRRRGVTISTDQSGDFLAAQHQARPIDWYVHTAALPADHPELIRAKQLGIRTGKRDELLAHIIAEKNLKLIAIAGTHGKTTTTGMMVWALKQLGLPVSYSVGTTLSWGPSGYFDPASEYFVYECDEFDRNFLHFSPLLSLITSLEHDHPDTYPTATEYYQAFSQFIAQSKQTIMWAKDAAQLETPASTWLLGDSEVQSIALDGEHNRRNATLVAKGIEYLNLAATPDDVSKTLASFPGTNRRFERLTENLYTDYGHTPAEIAATLQMARERSDHVVLVYQPHQNIRQHEIIDQYVPEIFADADEVFWLPTYLSREDPKLEILSPAELMRQLPSEKFHEAAFDDALWQTIIERKAAGALVIGMGAGAIDGWLREQLASEAA